MVVPVTNILIARLTCYFLFEAAYLDEIASTALHDTSATLHADSYLTFIRAASAAVALASADLTAFWRSEIKASFRVMSVFEILIALASICIASSSTS